MGRTTDHLAFVGEITAGARLIHRHRVFDNDNAGVWGGRHGHGAGSLDWRESEPDAQKDRKDRARASQTHDGTNRVPTRSMRTHMVVGMGVLQGHSRNLAFAKEMLNSTQPIGGPLELSAICCSRGKSSIGSPKEEILDQRGYEESEHDDGNQPYGAHAPHHSAHAIVHHRAYSFA
jgi:hypothetical protein